MKISYLIVAHTQPGQLLRQIKALSHPDVRFFLNVDRSSDIGAFSEVLSLDQVHLLEPRASVAHGGFSLSQVYVRLCQLALATFPADYVVFLSGACYPIKSNAEIRRFFEGCRDAETGQYLNLISFYQMLPGANLYEHYTRYYFRDFEKRHRYLTKLCRLATRLLPRKRLPKDLAIFRGTCWSALNADTARFLVAACEDDYGKRVQRLLKYSFGSDEMYVQTMVMNSPFAAQTLGYKEFAATGKSLKGNEAYFHYIDWSPSRGRPAVLDMRDHDKLMASPALFARKFDSEVSAELLEKLDSSRATA